jgi:hypothetical protein
MYGKRAVASIKNLYGVRAEQSMPHIRIRQTVILEFRGAYNGTEQQADISEQNNVQPLRRLHWEDRQSKVQLDMVGAWHIVAACSIQYL